MPSIKLLTMGGDIDNPSKAEEEHDPTAGGRNRVYHMARIASSGYDSVFMSPTRISHTMGAVVPESDRKRLFGEIAWAQHTGFERVIVTTDIENVVSLAQEAKRELPGMGVPVIFTAASWPEIQMGETDGFDNLTSAVVRGAEPGVFIAVGKVFADASIVDRDPKRKLLRANTAQPATAVTANALPVAALTT